MVDLMKNLDIVSHSHPMMDTNQTTTDESDTISSSEEDDPEVIECLKYAKDVYDKTMAEIFERNEKNVLS
jgi:hypothetical protein